MNINQIKNDILKIKTTTFGISIPELKKFAKQIAKDDYKDFLDNNKCETFELRLLHAFVLGFAKDDINTLLDYFEKFVPYVDDWAVNDSLCQSFKIARKYPEIVWKYLMKYKKSKKEFESRIVSVMLLSHYLKDEYIDRVLKVLDSLCTNDYYSQMGVAWALATAVAYYPEKCIEYMKSEDCHLDDITHRKTLQKIRESYRVSDKVKQYIKENIKRRVKK